MESSSPPEYLTKAFHRDLKLFVNHPDIGRALVFPPVNSFSRFCLHSLVQNDYPQLTTFSVGSEKERRPVVCHQQAVADFALKGAVISPPTPTAGTGKQPLKQQRSSDKSDDQAESLENEKNSANSRQRRKRPDRPVYAPPGSNRRSSKGVAPVDNNNSSAATNGNSNGDSGEPVKPVKPDQIEASKPEKISTVVPNLEILAPDADYQTEIETVLGPYVRLVNPLSDFLALEAGCVTQNDVMVDELPNVVEIYDFPSDYKTDHLEDCLHRNLRLINYYDLKWVDDTHALAIFSDVETADKALNISDSFIKFRPFWSASPQSMTKAKILKLTTESTSFKRRPDTSTVMAKRLLARALGMPAIATGRSDRELPRRGAARAK